MSVDVALGVACHLIAASREMRGSRGRVASTIRPWLSCRSPEMDASAWSAQLLAEFVAAVSTAETGTAAAHAAVERAAEALDADLAAIVWGGELVAAVGYPQGSALVAELAAVRPGVADAWLQVPGPGS